MICDLDDHRQLCEALARKLDAAVYETHISSVLVADGHAWKIKKPVDLGFLDFSTLEKRRHCCEEEIRLNGRLAPDVYQRVAAITGSVENPAIDGEGEVIEYAVQMREFPADALLADDPALLDASLIDAIAEQVALFQRSAAVASQESGFGQPGAVLAPMLQNFEQILARIEEASDRQRLAALQAWTETRFAELHPLLEMRPGNGRIREGHGDMHLGNIAVEEGRAIIFDGIEFNPQLRWIDVMSEVAFLVMDLQNRGHTGLAWRFLNGYLTQTGDFAGVGLLNYYLVYRALVRAKVAILRLAQPGMDMASQQAARDEYRSYMALAGQHSGPQRPALIIMHGVSGSGKSWYATRLAEQLGAIRIRSDVERKRLYGYSPEAKTASGIGSGIYTTTAGMRTYDQLARLARHGIDAGYPVIIDATFLGRGQRERFRQLAATTGVPFVILACTASQDTLRQRILMRQAADSDPSEAGMAVLESQLQSQEPLGEDEQANVLSPVPDGSESLETLADRLAGRMA